MFQITKQLKNKAIEQIRKTAQRASPAWYAPVQAIACGNPQAPRIIAGGRIGNPSSGRTATTYQQRFERLRKTARFRYQASIEEIVFDTSRGLDKSQVSQMIIRDYISKREPVLVTGATGCGKSFLASALRHHACTQGHKVTYYNVQKLPIKTKMERVDRTICILFEQLAKTDLLAMDDFGLTHLEKQQQLDLMEIIEDRHFSKATITASQLPVVNWYNIIGEETIADAMFRPFGTHLTPN